MNYYDDDYVDEEYQEHPIVSFLAIASKWFIRIGMVVALILFIYYIVNAKVLSAFVFIVALVIAFFFGYLFMYLLDYFTSRN